MEALINLFKTFFELFQWFVIIQPWELAIRVRMGRTITPLEPGFHWRLPYLDNVYRQSVRLRITNCPTQTIETRDGKPISFGATLTYAIDDVEKLYQTVHHAEDTISNMVMVAVAREIASRMDADVTAEGISLAATRRIQFGRYGLDSKASIQLTDFVRAKPYRFIMDQRDLGYGKALDTESNQKVSE